jgi:hypothetical protein
LFAQKNVEVIAGLNQNQFFDLNRDEGHYYSSYQSELGYALRIGIEDVKVDWLNLRFTLGYDKYGGKIAVSDGGQGGGYTTTAEIDKSLLSLGIFPVNLKIWNRIDLNLGFEVSALVDENYRGKRSGGITGAPSWNENLEDRYDSYSEKGYWGIRGRLAYDFTIDDRFSLSPQYSYYFGMSNEFKEFPEETKSMRHYFSIGVQWEL